MIRNAFRKFEAGLTPARRQYAYRLAWVLLGVFVTEGWITKGDLDLINLVLMALLGMADRNVKPLPLPHHSSNNLEGDNA